MSFKKYNDSAWQPITPKKLKGIPYTGTLPAILTGTKAGYLHRYKIYGNLEQTGTPTPENPIVPSECGERTENLLNFADLIAAPEGRIESYNFSHLLEITLKPDTTYTMYSNGYGSISGAADTNRSMYFDGIDSSDCVFANHASTKTTDSTGKLKIGFMSQRTNAQQYINNTAQVWIIEGSTALPYEPYGYKLPLTSAGQSVDIYLGESQSTRQIKKLVLTGEENWLRQSPSHTTCINLYVAINNAKSNGMIMSNVVTHSGIAGASNDSLVNVGRINGAGTNLLIDMDLSEFETLTAWQTYLRQQYANGTPVTVWYVLATEETGTLNEPLRKIGDYADIIDSTQTSAQIPTSANSTTISWAGSGLAPSEFDSIQEWVDATTYKRINGEWVADN